MYFIRFILFCADSVNDFLHKNCPFIAAAISFYTLFSMFPLFLAIISILSFPIGPGASQAQLAKEVARIVPVSTDFLSKTVEDIVRARAITGIASVFGLLWASTAAFGAIRKGINAAWGIKKTRPFLKERLMDFALVLGAGLLMLGFLFITAALSFLREIVEYLYPGTEVSALWDFVGSLTSPALSFLTFLVLYRYLPNTRVRTKDVWLGALAASAAFDGAKWGFITYVKAFPVFNVIYGSIGAVMALLTWVYVSAIILLFGALVTSRYAACAAQEKETQGLKVIWTGLTRVRLRVVASTEAG